MSWVFEHRASTILYNVLLANKDKNLTFLLPANVCPIVPATFEKAGVNYEFVDITEQTLCIDLDIVSQKLHGGTNFGLLYVRNLGVMDEKAESYFKKFKSHQPDCFIIDDRCPARIDFSEEVESSFVDVTLFSTGYAKYVEMGHGGYAILSNDVDYERQVLKYEDQDHTKLVEAFNHSIKTGEKLIYKDSHWLNTAIPDISFENWQEEIYRKRDIVDQHKSRLNEIYLSSLPEAIVPKINCVHDWRFNIFVAEKERLLTSIFNSGLFASSHYSSVSHLFKSKKSVISENVHARIVNLFNDYRFSEADAKSVCKIVQEHVRKYM